MKRRTPFVLCLSVVLLSLGQLACEARTNVSYQKLKIGSVWMNVITANLNSPSVRVTPAVARYGIGHCESFRSLLRRTRPAAAIDGTFFCTRTLRPTGDIVIDGQLVYRGYLGMAVTIDDYDNIRFVESGAYRWSDYKSVLAAGPSLLIGGKVAVYPKDQGFRSGVHFSRRVRAAVGITRQNKLLLVTTTRSAYLSQLARAMRSIGCVDAAGLDGGSSTGLYCKGRLISNPSRGMTNCLLVYDDLTSYDRHHDSLCPTQRFAGGS